MSNAVVMHTIGFIGGGRMAEALISGVLTARLFEPGKIRVADPDTTRQDHLQRHYGVHVGLTHDEVVRASDVVMLAVKPQVIADVLRGLGKSVSNRLVGSGGAGFRIN